MILLRVKEQIMESSRKVNLAYDYQIQLYTTGIGRCGLNVSADLPEGQL